jgi:hypothetical protein
MSTWGVVRFGLRFLVVSSRNGFLLESSTAHASRHPGEETLKQVRNDRHSLAVS